MNNSPVPQLLNRLRMRQVALLLAIDEKLTLRAAALALGLSQPAATKMLHELEDTLGQPLFERIGRGLRATPAGTRATAYFRGVQGTMESLSRELYEIKRGGSGRLRLGSIMAASPAHLTDTLVRTKERFPMLEITIDIGTSDRLMEMLDEGRLDLAIGRVPTNAGRHYVFRAIAEEELSLIVSTRHPLAGRRKVEFAELQAYPWVLQPLGSPMRDVIEQEFRAYHMPLPPGLVETASVLTTTDLIAKSQMIAVISSVVAARHEEHGLLHVLPCPLRHKLASYGSVVRADRPTSGAVAHFLELLHS
ncbi:LysR family transcriptional regulator [Bordetella holmesii]|uniref:LysR family transcriptional regulator n=1 Tax=Bordetella holmesii TaxID=35814 RepID=UPI0002BBD821|nr:LysR family transcriptional regulator [Bordetella holmesii]AHV91665.1 bacterial regulatory helix-turn-helix, lysR family protein [Bordetella holmesii ATCC 51541]AMD49232.1 LysR family transcriptional regulator [Bordetella holmesii F627]AUL21557.1 LysR family transcriptional regulator [Bordetella holmesii]AUL24877.1 LysR family transcriptional regulator [Bordetella holmesii]AUL28217.1 LysR family transcriptional regulator [Bordetella holmesii]